MKKILPWLLMAAIMASGYGVMKAEEPPTEMVAYVVDVDYDDTLWGICRRIVGDTEDVRKVIYRTMKENGIKNPGDLQPGQKLVIRVERK